MDDDILECDGYQIKRSERTSFGKRIFDLIKSKKVPIEKICYSMFYFIDETENTDCYEDWNESWIFDVMGEDEEN